MNFKSKNNADNDNDEEIQMKLLDNKTDNDKTEFVIDLNETIEQSNNQNKSSRLELKSSKENVNKSLKSAKFEIVKRSDLDTIRNENENGKESKLIKPTNLNIPNLVIEDWRINREKEINNTDFKVNNDKQGLITGAVSNDKINYFEEEDDVFNYTPLNDFAMDQINQTYRESEGQDTITPLSNNIYLKQLEKIKMKAALKKSISSSSKNSLNNSISSGQTQTSLTVPDVKSNRQSICNSNTPPPTIRSLFKVRESISSRKSIDMSSDQSSLLTEYRKSNILNKSQLDLSLLVADKKHQERQMSVSQHSMFGKKRLSFKGSSRSINLKTEEEKTVVKNKPDEVYNAVIEAIDKDDSLALSKVFFEQVINIVKIQQLREKRKKQNAKRLCLLVELIVIVFIITMGFFLIKNVTIQLKLINSRYLNILNANKTINVSDFISTPVILNKSLNIKEINR